MARCTTTVAEIMHRGTRDLVGRTAEGLSNASYYMESAPGRLQRLRTLSSAFINNYLTPEALARKYPETFGAVFERLSNAFAAYKRNQQRLSHSLLEELQLMGVRPGDEVSASMHMTQRIFRKDVIRLGPEGLRKAMTDFASGKRDAASTIISHRIDHMSPSDLAAYREHAAQWASKLEDRHLGMIRRLLDAEDEARNFHKKVFREQAEKQGLDQLEIETKLRERFGGDYESYAPTLRMLLHEAPEVAAYRGKEVVERAGMYAEDAAAFDLIYGDEKFFKESYAKALHELSQFLGDPKKGRAAPGFRFSDASSLKLLDHTYERADQAVADLFGMILPELNIADRKLLDLTVGTLKELGTKKTGPLYGYVEAIPEKVAVRFYERRTLSNLPVRADIISAHATYMNAVLKGAHMDPLLADINPILHKYEKGLRGDEVQLTKSFIDDIIGNPSRANKVSMDAMGKIMGALYQGTLVGNLSATMANYLGQTGFILAENGLRPTITAIRALAEGKRVSGAQYHPLLDLLDILRIGHEAIPRGEAGAVEHHILTKAGWHERVANFAQSRSIGEAARRMKQMAISDIDIFAASESRLHKVSFLSGAIKHLEKSGLWRDGMNAEQLAEAVRAVTSTPEGLEALVSAGERSIARGAFLFGNINAPAAVRWLKAEPSGIGQTIAMFSNYPVQGVSRILTWMNQAGQIGRDNAVAREGWGKLARFFAYGTMVAGPFFILPVLRGMASRGDESAAADLKNFFVSWEKNFSVAGLIGQAIEASSGEYETIELAQKLSPMPSITEPFGPLGTIGGGPAVQLGANIFSTVKNIAGSAVGMSDLVSKEAVESREALFGGWLENMATGLGNESRPLPSGGISTILPGGVAVARALNSILASGVFTSAPDVQLDRYGRLIRPTTMSAEIIRQFGRPLGEVLEASEGRISENEAETRSFKVERIKKAALDGSLARVGELLTEDPTLLNSLDPRDLARAALSKELTPQARAMLTSERSQMLKTLRRAAAILAQGDLSPAEEFTLNQQLAIGAMRLRRQ